MRGEAGVDIERPMETEKQGGLVRKGEETFGTVVGFWMLASA